MYLLLLCHFLYQLKHTHTQSLIDPSAWSTLQQADTDLDQMFRRRESSVSFRCCCEDTESALVLLGHFNWLALTGARLLESPPRLLDMEIYMKQEGREGIIFILLYAFYVTFMLSGEEGVKHRPQEQLRKT